jgi:hypothetical protein
MFGVVLPCSTFVTAAEVLRVIGTPPFEAGLTVILCPCLMKGKFL